LRISFDLAWPAVERVSKIDFTEDRRAQ